MRLGDALYFSPKYTFLNLEWNNKDNLIAAFKDRVEGFYLLPAQQLNTTGHAFAAGVICVTTIDFLAKVQTGKEKVGERIEEWLVANLPKFAQPDPQNRSRKLARRFYAEFRNGLVHEGCIKNGGQFSYDYEKLIRILGPVMVVNPTILLNEINTAFSCYMQEVSDDDFIFQYFKCALISCFRADMEYAKR